MELFLFYFCKKGTFKEVNIPFCSIEETAKKEIKKWLVTPRAKYKFQKVAFDVEESKEWSTRETESVRNSK